MIKLKSIKLLLLIITVLLNINYLKAAELINHNNILRVSDIKGNVFKFKKNKSYDLKINDIVNESYEIMTEEGAEVTLVDYNDHKFVLSGGSHLKISRKSLKLTRGYIWVQSYNKTIGFNLETTNSYVSYKEANFIVSFDNYINLNKESGKTQVLVINGKVNFHNIHEENLSYLIESGEFSYIDDYREKGFPRKPTPIGYKSMGMITKVFYDFNQKSIELRSNRELRGRNIASVKEKKYGNDENQGLKKLKSEYLYKTLDVANKEKKRKRLKKDYDKNYKDVNYEFLGFKKSTLKDSLKNIAILKNSQQVKRLKVKRRSIASVKETKPKKVRNNNIIKKTNKFNKSNGRVPASLIKDLNTTLGSNNFKKSMSKKYREQKKHPAELNQLIDELQSIDKSYDKKY
jgi:hypothetical protein